MALRPLLPLPSSMLRGAPIRPPPPSVLLRPDPRSLFTSPCHSALSPRCFRCAAAAVSRPRLNLVAHFGASKEALQVVFELKRCKADKQKERVDWPVPLQDVNDELLKCGVCGGYLGLVAQIYAPLTLYGAKLDERFLFVLGCPSASCGVDRTSWRTIRFQKDVPSENTSQQDQTESAAGSSTASISGPHSGFGEVFNNQGWGEDASSSQPEPQQQDQDNWWDENWWDGYAGDDGYETEAMNLQELQSSLLEAGYAAAGSRNQHHHHHHHHHHHPRRGNQGDDGGSDSGEATTSNRTISESSLPSLPCFYVYTQSEESTPYDSATTRSENPAEGDPNDPLHEIEDPYGILEGFGELWEGEDYEPDQALSADRTYLKFKKNLDISPEQCFRYCFGGRPLWATDVYDESGTCGACGGPCVYEMQLMPPVLYFLQQAYKDLSPSAYGPNDWEWSTLVVYSCARVPYMFQ